MLDLNSILFNTHLQRLDLCFLWCHYPPLFILHSRLACSGHGHTPLKIPPSIGARWSPWNPHKTQQFHFWPKSPKSHKCIWPPNLASSRYCRENSTVNRFSAAPGLGGVHWRVMNEANHLKFDQGQPRVKGIFPQKMAGCSWYSSGILQKRFGPKSQCFSFCYMELFFLMLNLQAVAHLLMLLTSWWLNHPFEKYISQIGSFPQVGVKIKNIWNHHPGLIYIRFHLLITITTKYTGHSLSQRPRESAKANLAHVKNLWDSIWPMYHYVSIYTMYIFMKNVSNMHLCISSWWFQPIWKILVKMGNLPQIAMKIKKCFKKPPPRYIYIYYILLKCIIPPPSIITIWSVPWKSCFGDLCDLVQILHVPEGVEPKNRGKNHPKSSICS